MTEPVEPAPAVIEPAAVAPVEPSATESAPITPDVAPAPAAVVAEAKWRDDWREALANGDDKAMARLKRFQSPETVFKSWSELDRKMASGALRSTLPDNPSADDVATYRKSWGVPDAVEGYDVKPPAGMTLAEPEQRSLNSFLGEMHGANVPKDTVQRVAESYFKIRQQEEQELYEAAVDSTTNYRAEIKAEYGRDYDRNVRLGNAELVKQLGPDKAKEFSALTLANGTKLGDNPEFVRFIVGQALANADDSMLVMAESNGSGKSIEDEYRAALDMKFADPTKYHSETHQKRLLQLANARAGKSRAA